MTGAVYDTRLHGQGQQERQTGAVCIICVLYNTVYTACTTVYTACVLYNTVYTVRVLYNTVYTVRAVFTGKRGRKLWRWPPDRRECIRMHAHAHMGSVATHPACCEAVPTAHCTPLRLSSAQSRPPCVCVYMRACVYVCVCVCVRVQSLKGLLTIKGTDVLNNRIRRVAGGGMFILNGGAAGVIITQSSFTGV